MMVYIGCQIAIRDRINTVEIIIIFVNNYSNFRLSRILKQLIGSKYIIFNIINYFYKKNNPLCILPSGLTDTNSKNFFIQATTKKLYQIHLIIKLYRIAYQTL